MIRSQNLLSKSSILAPARTPAPRRAQRAPATGPLPRLAPSTQRAPMRNLATQALMSPDDVALVAETLTRAATVAGGAAGVLQGKEIADRVKEQLALAAFLLPRSADSQRMEGTAARSAEACYDAAAILATGLVGASLMNALARALPLTHLSQF